MIFAIDPLTRVRVHISLAIAGKVYECEHCTGRVFATEFFGGKLAFRHSENVHNDCIGANSPRCESWVPPMGYERPRVAPVTSEVPRVGTPAAAAAGTRPAPG